MERIDGYRKKNKLDVAKVSKEELEKNEKSEKEQILKWAMTSHEVPSSFDNVIKIQDYQETTDKVLNKSLSENKYRLAWFTQLSGVIQRLEALPEGELVLDCLPLIYEKWIVVRRDLQRRKEAEKNVNEQMFSDKIFIELSQFFGLTEYDQKFICSFLASKGLDKAVEYLWSLPKVQEKYNNIEEFSDYFTPVFKKMSIKFEKMRKGSNMMMSREAVEAGEEILDIIIKSLS